MYTRSSSPNVSAKSCGRCKPSTVSAVAIRPTTARAGVGAEVGAAVGRSVAAGDGVAAGVVGLADGDGDATGDGFGEGGIAVAVLGGVSGTDVGGACAVGAGSGETVGVPVEAGRGAAATVAPVAGAAGVERAGEGLAAAGGGCVDAGALGISVVSPLHAASTAITSARQPQLTATLAQDLIRVVQRRTMVLNSRRSLCRASGSGRTKQPETFVQRNVKSNNGRSADSVRYETEKTRRGVTQNVVSASVERLVQAPEDLLSRRVERRGQRGTRRQRVAAATERRGYAVDPWTA